MLEWREILGSLAVLLALAQVIPYVMSILRGHTRPSVTSYLIWASISILEAAAYVATVGFTPTAWPRVAFAATSLTVLMLALGKGRRTPFTRFEAWALVAAAIGGAIWLAFGTPLASMLVSAAVVAIAYATTIRKLVTSPGTEDLTAWLLTAIAGGLNLIILTTLSIPVLLPLLVTLVGAGIIVTILLTQRHHSELEADSTGRLPPPVP